MSKKIIGEKEIKGARETLQKYKNGKAALEARIVEEEMFWKQRHWEVLRSEDNKTKPSSGWMFNSIVNKHADAMDSFPCATCLPREESDKENATRLTSILPVVLERNSFEDVYSDNWWYKLKHGCCAYGVFWNNNAENGLGDVQVKRIDLLNLFWEPGIRDIQASKNLFICDLVSIDVLKNTYPKMVFKGGDTNEVKKYIYDDSIDTSDKVLVVDWYYKVPTEKGEVLHYCKFCEDNVLYSSENEGKKGWYQDGNYPVVMDVLYPEEGSIAGFGIVSITKDAQLYIDTLDTAIMNYANQASKYKVLTKRDSEIKAEDLLDPEKTVIETSGDVSDSHIRQLSLDPINNSIFELRDRKVEELKETSSNRDFSQGGVAGGVTSGAAIAVLQEAGSKTSRDMINASYRTFVKIIHLIIERMREFYTEERVFRIVGEDGQEEFARFNNSGITEQSMGIVGDRELFRRPVFDIDVRAERQNPYSTLSQNETAMNLYNAGFFDPDMAQGALAALKLMSFEGKKEVEDYIQQGATLKNQLMQMQQQNQMLMKRLGAVPEDIFARE